MNYSKLMVITALSIIGATSTINAQDRQLSPVRQTDENRLNNQKRLKPQSLKIPKKAPRRITARIKIKPPVDSIKPSSRQRKELRRTPDKKVPQRIQPHIPLIKSISPPLDDFPYQAQDFGNNERVFRGKKIHNPDNPNSTWQQFAYDIGASRQQSDGTWRDTKPTIDWKDPKNSDYYIYKKPVYAVSEGVIIKCWRNAPENPRPYTGELDNAYKGMPLSEQTWLHPDTRAGKVFGSGNFILVREDNGNHVHYAHGRPGTIPKKLCPNNGRLLAPATWEKDSSVPETQQVRVKRGDFLFETGNVGTSSAPHLHLDRTESDIATSVRFRFRNGLANPLTKSRKLKNPEWTSFAGKQIPPGPVLVWPPRREGGIWSWHSMTAKKWGEYFRHMSDSNYQMTWIDGYSVSGIPYFNTIWKPAKAGWLGYALLTGADFQKKFNQALSDGFALVHVDSVLAGGKPRYNAIFQKGTSKNFIAHHGQNSADFNATFKKVTKKGYSAVNASVLSVKGKLQYTTLYRKQNLGGWVLLPGIPKSRYQQVYNENSAPGRRPFYVNAYKHKGNVFYSVVFSQNPKGPRKDKHGMSLKTYQNEFNSAGNLALQAISGVDGAKSKHEYIGIWRKNN